MDVFIAIAVPDVNKQILTAGEYLADIYALPIGELIKTCIQCGTWSGACPNGVWLNNTPHKIIHAIQMKETIVWERSSEARFWEAIKL